MPVAAAVIALGVVAALAIMNPWRAREEGDDALRLVAAGDYSAARAAAERAHDRNGLSPEPYVDLAAIEDASGNHLAARKMLERAVQTEPANAETWRRLGDYLLVALDDPRSAIPVLRGALYLDPLSDASRGSLIVALRAEQLNGSRAAAPNRR